MGKKARVLIVDDELIGLRNLQHVMEKEGYEVQGTQSGQNALKLMEEKRFEIVITDLKMEKVDGMQILKKAKTLHPECEVILITGYATLQSAIQAMKKGAYDYVAKPFKLDEVRKVVAEAAEKVRLKDENARLREQIENFRGKVKIITQDAAMERLLDTAR
ncbi:MAG: response regulator, partial [Nitrospiraceae bacterium]|nr:response regulator [Nitrospiraceae bacterium]